MPFELYPAIDLSKGQVVRLTQGRPDAATVYGSDPAETAGQWIAQGARWLHVVDLDGAFTGSPVNDVAIREIVARARDAGVHVQLGGGLRSLDALEAALGAGVSRVIIGTRAVGSDLAVQAVSNFGADRIVVSIDAHDGFVATQGWAHLTGITAVDLARQVQQSGISTVVYTDISTDGMLSGPNFARLEQMGQTGLSVIASGGVASLADILRLKGMAGIRGVIIGKALYTGAIQLREALSLCH